MAPDGIGMERRDESFVRYSHMAYHERLMEYEARGARIAELEERLATAEAREQQLRVELAIEKAFNTDTELYYRLLAKRDEAAKGEGEMSECEKSPLGRHVASFSGRCKYCGWIPPAPPSYEEMQQRLAAAEEDNASLRNHLEAERGNYWAWQGDGEDHLESLSCPVVIQPQKLLEITARLAAAEAFVAKHKCGKCGGVRVTEQELCKCTEAAKGGRDGTPEGLRTELLKCPRPVLVWVLELVQRLAAAEALLREACDHMPDTADGWAENWIKRAEASLEWKP